MDSSILFRLMQIIFIGICSGALLTAVCVFGYISLRTRRGFYASLTVFNGLSFLYCVIEILKLFLSMLPVNQHYLYEMDKLQEVTMCFSIFAYPFILIYLQKEETILKKISRVAASAAFVLALAISIASYIVPELFMSSVNLISQDGIRAGMFYPAHTGLLYNTRNILIAAAVLFTIIAIGCIVAAKKSRTTNLFLISLGIIIVNLCALDDSFFLIHNKYIGLFTQYPFPRLITGMIIFGFFSTFTMVKYLLDRSDKLVKAYETINQSEERFNQIAGSINDVFCLLEYDTELETINLLYVNPAFPALWGRMPDNGSTTLDNYMQHIHTDDRKMLYDKLKNIYNKGSFDVEYRILMPDGTLKWVRDKFTRVKKQDEKPVRLARITEDISEHKILEEQLSYLAYHDSLTGLMNRKSFYEKLEEVIMLASRSKSEKIRALLFIDLDDFKDVNDSLGHSIGDSLLKVVSIRMRKSLRESDYLFRLGGDEFIIILNNLSDYSNAGIVAQKIINVISDPFTINNNELYIGICIGVSLFPQDGNTPGELIKKADTALFEAKKEKNLYKFYTKSMEEKAIEKVKIITNLRKAITNNEFALYYQPIVDFEGKIIGAESLVRWIHPEWGIVSPGKFISIAEETALIKPIGYWIIDRALSDWKSVISEYGEDLFISINLSVKQFADKSFIDNLINSITGSGLPPGIIHLEITESFLMEDVEDAITKLERLRATGVFISIDDFGTGYSSLGYLEKLPITTIKIDRSFIIGIPDKRESSPLVESLVTMAQKLNLRIIVEGIESVEQWHYLDSLSISGGMQGFLFSRPIPLSDLRDYIMDSRT